MLDNVFNVASSIVVLAMITAMTRPGSQGPKLVETGFSGFANSISAGLGGANYGKK